MPNTSNNVFPLGAQRFGYVMGTQGPAGSPGAQGSQGPPGASTAGSAAQYPSVRNLITVSPVAIYYNWATANSYTIGTVGAQNTVGSQFHFNESGAYCTGVFTYWAGGAATLKGSLWNNAGSRVASGTLAVSGAGFAFIPFSSPYAIAQADLGLPMIASVYNNSAATYTKIANNTYPSQPGGPSAPIDDGYLTWDQWSVYASGDAAPAANGAGLGESYMVEPWFASIATTTTSSFSQPAYGAEVTVPFTSVTGLLLGSTVFISGGGSYRVTAISGLNVTMINWGDGTNSVATSTVVVTDATVVFS
jgi:hypothetical protein